VNCSTNSSSPECKVLHRASPIAWPISFMEGDILKMQLISFYHGNENVTIVRKESLAARQWEPGLGELGVASVQAPRDSRASIRFHCGCALGSRASARAPQGVQLGHRGCALSVEGPVAWAGAQCQPVTACSQHGTVWGGGEKVTASSGLPTGVLESGSRGDGVPRRWRAFVATSWLKRARGKLPCCHGVSGARGCVAACVQVLVEAKARASWGGAAHGSWQQSQ